MLVFRILGMILGNQLPFWCVYEQLRQILLILASHLMVFELYSYDVRFSYLCTEIASGNVLQKEFFTLQLE